MSQTNLPAEPVRKIRLCNGVEVPQIALGTFLPEGGSPRASITYAVKETGYRHTDSSPVSHNEEEVGQGLKDSGVPREDLFISTRFWCTFHDRVEEQLDQSLRDLGVDYVDLLLLHWPVTMNPKGNHPYYPTTAEGHRDIIHDWPLKNTWAQMERLYKSGKARAIGVANCSRMKLEEEILPFCEIPPMINYLELHPYNPQHELTAWLREKDIAVGAWATLGFSTIGQMMKRDTRVPAVMRDEVILEIAKNRDVTPAQVIIGWGVAKGFIVATKSADPQHITQNRNYATLDPSEVERLDGLAAAGKQCRNIRPPWTGAKMGFSDWMVGGEPTETSRAVPEHVNI